MPEQPAVDAKSRMRQVLEFLREFQRRRTPPTRRLSEYDWHHFLADLPCHHSIQFMDRTAASPETVQESFVLKICRPVETPCPPPTGELKDWVQPSWHAIDAEPQRVPYRNVSENGEARTISFEASEARLWAWDEWTAQRAQWVVAELLARDAGRVYQRIYQLYGQLMRESERVQLFIGDGILHAKDTVGTVEHPVLLQRLELHFDPNEPSFEFTETDDLPELATGVIGAVVGEDGQPLADSRQLADCQRELSAKPWLGPLDGSETTGWLGRLVKGVFQHGWLQCDGESPPEGPATITLRRALVLFLAPRIGAFITAIDSALTRLAVLSDEDVPRAFSAIVGVDLASDHAGSIDRAERPEPGPVAVGQPDNIELLLTRPANPEQEQIIRQLERYGMVLVQGPPGTGKTHTIANLVGHLLAQGKTILITSHTAKALRVVREKIHKEIQPLCVSILGAEAQSRNELEQSVAGINVRLGAADQTQLDQQKAQGWSDRCRIKADYDNAIQVLSQAIRDEYDDIIVGGAATSPADAARKLAEWSDSHDWLPGPVTPCAVMPLAFDEVQELYASNAQVAPDEEVELLAPLPSMDALPGSGDFEAAVSRIQVLDKQDLHADLTRWPRRPDVSREVLKDLGARLSRTITMLEAAPPWQRAAIQAGYQGAPSTDAWTQLTDFIESTCSFIQSATPLLHARQPAADRLLWPLDRIERVCTEIERHLRARRTIGFLRRVTKPEWRKLIAATSVVSGSPRALDDFAAIRKSAKTSRLRVQLQAWWTSQMTAFGLAVPAEFESHPEDYCHRFIALVREAIAWWANVAIPLQQDAQRIGFPFANELARGMPDASETPFVERWLAVVRAVTRLIEHRRDLLELEALNKHLDSCHAALTSRNNEFCQTTTGADIASALATRDCHQYKAALGRFQRLHDALPVFQRRSYLLDKLAAAAPHWAQAIRLRHAGHDSPQPIGDPRIAWTFRQYAQELDRRASTDIDQLQRRANELADDVCAANAEFVVASTWAEQLRRCSSLSQRQALKGWLATAGRLGFKSGVRSAALQAQAREELAKCRSSVPVWIMPIIRVAEAFEFATTLFDVVVIDEASQCDVLGLLLLTVAKQVVIVGDDKQVSPSAVGQQGAQAQSLIDQFLHDIPNPQLYDGRASIYELAGSAFGPTVCLLEHFRCVPEIIQFSNHLCYGGRIKPLRECSDVVTRPSVVEYRVAGLSVMDDVNSAEAEAVASLLVAATEQPEYAGATFGVISMVSSSRQAEEIDRLLRLHLRETEYAARRIICGNPAEFQGDERHVVFLSMVDDASEGPESMKQSQTFQQRFNVAASRAQNQLWVVHSLNLDTDLKPGDLRRRLIEHARDPSALASQLAETTRRAQSEFERQVIRRLVDHGYRLVPQWRVGAFAIDIVVFGEQDRKVAIECDGDRFHPPERQQADYDRQLMLERLGWRFIRVRSSQFFRDPDAAMQRIFSRLTDLDILPIGPPSDTKEPDRCTTELKDRVVRRADELRRIWKETAERAVKADEARVQRPKQAKLSGRVATSPAEPTSQAAPKESSKQQRHVEPSVNSNEPAGPMTAPRPAQRELFGSSSSDTTHKKCPKCGRRLLERSITLHNGERKYLQCEGKPQCGYREDISS